MAYNREAQRAYLAVASAKAGRRVYKSAVVIDLAGISLAHMDKRTIDMLKAVNAVFAYNYPESVVSRSRGLTDSR